MSLLKSKRAKKVLIKLFLIRTIVLIWLAIFSYSNYEIFEHNSRLLTIFDIFYNLFNTLWINALLSQSNIFISKSSQQTTTLTKKEYLIVMIIVYIYPLLGVIFVSFIINNIIYYISVLSALLIFIIAIYHNYKNFKIFKKSVLKEKKKDTKQNGIIYTILIQYSIVTILILVLFNLLIFAIIPSLFLLYFLKKKFSIHVTQGISYEI